MRRKSYTEGVGVSVGNHYSVYVFHVEGLFVSLVPAVWVMFIDLLRSWGRGVLESKAHLQLYTLSVIRGESGNMYSGRILVFSLHIILGKNDTKHGVGNHDQTFSGRHYTITAHWLSAAAHTFFSK